MKLAPRQINAFLQKPDDAVRGVLIYGPDTGLVDERAKALTSIIVADANDPFRIAELAATVFREEPSRLSDEMASLAFTGGRRVVRVRDAGNALAPMLAMVLAEETASDSLLVVEAGDLSPRDKLRQAFENADNAVAIPCYLDEGSNLEHLIVKSLRDAGFRVEPAAIAYLCDSLGTDRQLTRQELNKLVLYKGEDSGEITLDDVDACIADGAPLALSDVSFCTANGEQEALDKAIGRCYQSGENPISMLRAVNRHFQRLHAAAGAMARGQSAEQAMKALRPPVFFKYQAAFRGQLQQWSEARVGKALSLLLEAESDCKSTGIPIESVCSYALLRIAQAARAVRR